MEPRGFFITVVKFNSIFYSQWVILTHDPKKIALHWWEKACYIVGAGHKLELRHYFHHWQLLLTHYMGGWSKQMENRFGWR